MDQQTMESINVYAPHVASAAGTVLSAKGDVDAGNAAARSARIQAAQLRQNAGQQIAAATQAAQEEQRKSDLIASRAIALAAASGGGVADPTVIRILQGIQKEGAMAVGTQLYNGQEAARGLETQAKVATYEGNLARKFYRNRALATTLEGASKLSATWGSGTFKEDQQKKGTLDAGSRMLSSTYA